MEKFQEFRDLAGKKLQLADHILTMTYPIVRDSRLLMAVAENLFLSLNYAMSSVLYYERLFKRIPPFPESFTSKLHLFKEKCADMYKIKEDQIKLIEDLKEIIVNHKESPIEFQRKDHFVICNNNYRMRAISVNQLKTYISIAKSFITNTNTIVSKNELLFT